jgi:glycine betaine/choline ABC-type transport system substrate-binding protein
MTKSTITTDATLEPDGMTVHFDKRIALPPGRVTVTVESIVPKAGPSMLDVLERIHADQRQRACKPMTDEEMAAEIATMRAEDDDYEDQWRKIWSHTGAHHQDGG